MQVDYLFKGSHPAFYWAAALLKKKGKSVAILPGPEMHSWELFPSEVVEMLGLTPFKTDRDIHPIQILTPKFRAGIFADLEVSKKDKAFCVGQSPAPELNRGLTFYAKGSDYPVVFGDGINELLAEAHQMEYFEKPPGELEHAVQATLKKMGITILSSQQALPTAEQTVVLDLNRAKVFRTKFEFTMPMKQLPVGASNRMLFVERNSPLIEMIYQESKLTVRTLLPADTSLVEKMVNAIRPYFAGQPLSASTVTVSAPTVAHQEWLESKSNVDSSKTGIWLISPAINPELGERSLYARLSELLTKKYKKVQVFEHKELFHN